MKKKIKSNKGITLIALIITIIVMLILVAVTVSVTLDSGLFTTAKEVGKKTEIEAERETLQGIVVGAVNEDGNVNFENINLPTGWNKKGDGRYIVSPNGNEFTVYENGTIVNENDKSEDLKKLEEYCLGKEKNGVILSEIISDFSNFTFKGNETINNASSSINFLTVGFQQYNKEVAYIKYNNKAYKVLMNITNEDGNIPAYTTNSIELAYEPNGKEGQKVMYDSDGTGEKEWTILYDYGDTIEIVSPEVIGSLTLGVDNLASNHVENAIESYNTALEDMNNYCDSLITNEEKISVRSVGSNPKNSSNENSEFYKSENLSNINSDYNGRGKGTDINPEQDFIRMSFYGVIDTGTEYWLASRYISEKENEEVCFGIRYFKQITSRNDAFLWKVNVNGDVYTDSYTKGVRPIVKIQASSNP